MASVLMPIYRSISLLKVIMKNYRKTHITEQERATTIAKPIAGRAIVMKEENQ